LSKFKLSKRSLSNLETVDGFLQSVVKRAIEITEVDFGVTQGIRTLEEQRQMVKDGASRTMNSKHLIGDAVDLVAYRGKNITWEMAYYYKIYAAMRVAYFDCAKFKRDDVKMRWGGAWNTTRYNLSIAFNGKPFKPRVISDLEYAEAEAKIKHRDYVLSRTKKDKTPFVDAPHFELNYPGQMDKIKAYVKTGD
jgi:peptidoglycan L-alanyl-D-glutamate endopeptidase CwlK